MVEGSVSPSITMRILGYSWSIVTTLEKDFFGMNPAMCDLGVKNKTTDPKWDNLC